MLYVGRVRLQALRSQRCCKPGHRPEGGVGVHAVAILLFLTLFHACFTAGRADPRDDAGEGTRWMLPSSS